MDTMGEKTGPQKITAKSLSEFHFTKKKSREKLIFSSLTGRMEESIKLQPRHKVHLTLSRDFYTDLKELPSLHPGGFLFRL